MSFNSRPFLSLILAETRRCDAPRDSFAGPGASRASRAASLAAGNDARRDGGDNGGSRRARCAARRLVPGRAEAPDRGAVPVAPPPRPDPLTRAPPPRRAIRPPAARVHPDTTGRSRSRPSRALRAPRAPRRPSTRQVGRAHDPVERRAA